MLLIGLVGDHDPTVTAHAAIPRALDLSALATGIPVEWEWIATERILSLQSIEHCQGVWCVPNSPYRNTEGALLAIRYARENAIPFLGTCGGFQHALLEYARNVARIHDAAHAESEPEALVTVVVPLACTLRETAAPIRLLPGSRLHKFYGTDSTSEKYNCGYGLNPAFRDALVGDLAFSAFDENGDVRALELKSHPFFVATLFQPERSALSDISHPLIEAFLTAVRGSRSGIS